MEFGLFAEQTRRGASQDDAFREMFALVDASEAWGLDVFWLAEMLINPTRSVLSGPLLVASWIAARTRRLRVGTAVQLQIGRASCRERRAVSLVGACAE